MVLYDHCNIERCIAYDWKIYLGDDVEGEEDCKKVGARFIGQCV